MGDIFNPMTAKAAAVRPPVAVKRPKYDKPSAAQANLHPHDKLFHQLEKSPSEFPPVKVTITSFDNEFINNKN